jgi:hypothetical protein
MSARYALTAEIAQAEADLTDPARITELGAALKAAEQRMFTPAVTQADVDAYNALYRQVAITVNVHNEQRAAAEQQRARAAQRAANRKEAAAVRAKTCPVHFQVLSASGVCGGCE